jgi:hypothetical protein
VSVPFFSRVEEAPTEVIGESIAEIDDVVFNGHDFAMIGSTVGWSPKTAAHHLHLQNRAEDGPGDHDHVCLWSIEAGRQDAVIADYP